MSRISLPIQVDQSIAQTAEPPDVGGRQRAAGARLWRAGARRRVHLLLRHLHPSGAGARHGLGALSGGHRRCRAGPAVLAQHAAWRCRAWAARLVAGRGGRTLFHAGCRLSGIPRSSSRMSPMRRCWRMSHRLSSDWCALLVFHERLRISYWLGLAIALCGMGIIIGHDLFSGSGFGAGDLLAMMAGFFYALYMLVIQRVRVWMDTLSSLWISTVVGTLLLLALNMALGRSMWGFTPSQYVLSSRWGRSRRSRDTSPSTTRLATCLPRSSRRRCSASHLTALLAVPLLSESLEPRQISVAWWRCWASSW